MDHPSTSLLILAAGLGSRFGADKQIIEISSLKLPILAFTLQDAAKNAITHAVIVTRSALTGFFERNIFPRFPSMRFDLVYQDQSEPPLPIHRTKPWGTGHAVLCAQNYSHGRFIVANGDDFYGPHAIVAAAHFLENSGKNQCCCVGYPLVHTLSPNGPVSRGILQTDGENFVTAIDEITQIQQLSDGTITASREATDAADSALVLQPQQPVSLNLFGLDGSIFPILEREFKNFFQENHNSTTAEFYLPTTITASDVLSKIITMKMLPTQDRWLGITHKNDLPFVGNQLNQLVAQGLYIS
jgi:UTP-glucose-1-phosphate uridylyltransferase